MRSFIALKKPDEISNRIDTYLRDVKQSGPSQGGPSSGGPAQDLSLFMKVLRRESIEKYNIVLDVSQAREDTIKCILRAENQKDRGMEM